MTLSVYMAMADQEVMGERPSVFFGLNDPAVAALRCFRGYSKEARWSPVLRAGKHRLYTDAMMRVEAIALRVGTNGSGYTTTRELAAEARVSPGYVSKLLTRLEMWGVIGTIRTRGRNGKLFLFARTIGDHLDHFVTYAKGIWKAARLRSEARWLRRHGNVSSPRTVRGRGMEVSTSTSVRRVETFTAEVTPELVDSWDDFTRAVVHERARLAVEDPDGERDAVHPLEKDYAEDLMWMTEPRQRRFTGPGSLAGALGLDGVKQKGRIPCPAHGDHRKPTMSYQFTPEGGLLVHCFAGCTFDEIRKAAGA